MPIARRQDLYAVGRSKLADRDDHGDDDDEKPRGPWARAVPDRLRPLNSSRPKGGREFDAGAGSYAAVGGPNQVVSASAKPGWVRSPTQAT
jgi:hypothetical protein